MVAGLRRWGWGAAANLVQRGGGGGGALKSWGWRGGVRGGAARPPGRRRPLPLLLRSGHVRQEGPPPSPPHRHLRSVSTLRALPI